MSHTSSGTNGVMSATQAPSNYSSRVILAENSSRILCVANIRGDYHELNRLIREHEATAVIHTGDFGFLNADSLERMGDNILQHLLQYSPLIPPVTRDQLLSIPAQAGRGALIQQLNSSSIHFPLSQFPHLLSGAITFPVPVFTVWGVIEDVRIVEKFRTGEYEVRNLTIIDESSSALLETPNLKLRLFGLGGAVQTRKLFDNGEGFATIAGGQGTMWTTALQIGELVDTAQRLYSPAETRVLVTSSSVMRTGLLSLLALSLKADLTISGGLHFRYPASLNDYAVNRDFEAYRQKLVAARDDFIGVYDVVKDRVENILNEQQQILLRKVLAMVQKIPTVEDNSWTNTWHWSLTDALCGHLLLAISEGRVSAELRGNGLNFAHRTNQALSPPSAPISGANVPLTQVSRSAAEIPRTAVPPKPTTAGVPTKPVPAKPMTAPIKPGNVTGAKASAAVSRSFVRGQSATTTTASAPLSAKGEKGLESSITKEIGQKPSKPAAAASANALSKDKDIKKDGERRTSNGEKGDAEGGTETPKTGPQTPKRFSLYLKGLPIPTSEADIKSFFGTEADKIIAVKLVYDAAKKQKNFAYVDFSNETDLQETLKSHPSGTIRDFSVTVEISNPPIRGISERGRGRRRGGRGGSASSKDGPKGDGRTDRVGTPKAEHPKGNER